MQAYCFKCRKNVEIKDEQKVVLKNLRAAARGVCSVCGTRVIRMTGRA